MSLRIGIIGMGFMGKTHFEAYDKIDGAAVVAIADRNPKRAAGDLNGVWGNIGEGALTQLPMQQVQSTTDWRHLLAMSDIDVIDICVPTSAHREVAIAALEAGKHVLCEKPLALAAADAQSIADAAERAAGLFMPAMCMRFWPQWAWLKQAVDDGRYGKVLAATFRRVASPPPGWFRDGEMSGGALFDLHIHDTDFVYYLFGKPRAVTSQGYSKTSGRIDHVATQYDYEHVPLVQAEGSWCMQGGFTFEMRYTVNFENATADFDLSRADPLIVSQDGHAQPVDCGGGDGYGYELAYFIDCVQNARPPATVTAGDAVAGIHILEAEGRSVLSGQPVPL